MEEQIPEEFIKVTRDFVTDLKHTFPEYKPLIHKWWKGKEHFEHIEEEEDRKNAYEKAEKKSMKVLFEYTKKKLPPRFFDILYQNEDIFKEDSDTDTEFFPNIHFKNLWQCDITDKTRETIWKYLQLMLFSIVGTMDNKEEFGDTAKLFEAINQDEFKNKLEETLSQMHDLFDMSLNNTEESGDGGVLPNADKINEHITGMLDGKIGQLAREIAEETANDLNLDLENVTDMKDVFQNLVRNPSKLMGLVKNVGNKLDSKLKSGELKESEMIEEATEIMNKMKSMPGMGNIQSMLSKMGLGGLGGLGGKVNTGAMEAQLNQRLKTAKMKERIRAKAEANELRRQQEQLLQQQQQQQQPMSQNPSVSEEELFKVFSVGDKVEKTPRNAKPSNTPKKKKGKK